MYAVVRETSYAADRPIYESQQFAQFQQAHSRLPRYRGTIVVDVGGGRLITLTLWQVSEEMTTAREAMEPVVDRFLNPLMTAPTKLLGTGAVVVNDIVQMEKASR
jgi:hypothetical protein